MTWSERGRRRLLTFGEIGSTFRATCSSTGDTSPRLESAGERYTVLGLRINRLTTLHNSTRYRVTCMRWIKQ